jgi:hypothetical protein
MVYQRNSGMKRVLWRAGGAVILVLLVGLMSAGCGEAAATSTTTAKTTTATSVTSTKTASSPTTTTTTSSTAKTTTTSKTISMTSTKTVSTDLFIRLDDRLEELGVYFQKKWMAAEAVGAKEGYKYATYSGTFELYLYDQGSEAYKTAVKNNAMALGDTLFPAIIKNGFALYFYPNAKEELKAQIQGILFS